MSTQILCLVVCFVISMNFNLIKTNSIDMLQKVDLYSGEKYLIL